MDHPSDTDRPLDLRALDPDRDPQAEERLVTAVMRRVSTEASRHPHEAGALLGVWSLARPLALAASVLLVAGSAWLAWSPGPPPAAPRTVAEAIGIPPEFLASAEAARP